MGVEWVMYLQSQIFTRIKNEFSSKLKTKYNMTASNFSTVGSSNTPAVFPFVYMEELGWIPNGEDLERCSLNGVKDYTLRIHVTDNKSQTRAKEIAFEILRIMVKMQFSCKIYPNNTQDGTHSFVIHCNINKDKNDIL